MFAKWPLPMTSVYEWGNEGLVWCCLHSPLRSVHSLLEVPSNLMNCLLDSTKKKISLSNKLPLVLISSSLLYSLLIEIDKCFYFPNMRIRNRTLQKGTGHEFILVIFRWWGRKKKQYPIPHQGLRNSDFPDSFSTNDQDSLWIWMMRGSE
jgi:hypothetical protein